jgi:hypothetical protein
MRQSAPICPGHNGFPIIFRLLIKKYFSILDGKADRWRVVGKALQRGPNGSFFCGGGTRGGGGYAVIIGRRKCIGSGEISDHVDISHACDIPLK